MNNRLVITSENFTTKKLCWFVLSSTKLTHPHSWLCINYMEVPDLYHASCQTLLTIWGLPLPPALPVLGLHVTVAGLNKRVSTTHYTQKSRSNLFYAYFAGERLVICWHPDHFEFSFCSIPHRSLIIIRIWSSGGLSCFLLWIFVSNRYTKCVCYPGSGKSLRQGGLSCIFIQFIRTSLIKCSVFGVCICLRLLSFVFSSSCVCISSGKSLGQEGLPCFFLNVCLYFFFKCSIFGVCIFCTSVCVCISSS